MLDLEFMLDLGFEDEEPERAGQLTPPRGCPAVRSSGQQYDGSGSRAVQGVATGTELPRSLTLGASTAEEIKDEGLPPELKGRESSASSI